MSFNGHIIATVYCLAVSCLTHVPTYVFLKMSLFMTFKKSDIQHDGEMSETFFCLSDLFLNANTSNFLYDKSCQNLLDKSNLEKKT